MLDDLVLTFLLPVLGVKLEDELSTFSGHVRDFTLRVTNRIVAVTASSC